MGLEVARVALAIWHFSVKQVKKRLVSPLLPVGLGGEVVCRMPVHGRVLCGHCIVSGPRLAIIAASGLPGGRDLAVARHAGF